MRIKANSFSQLLIWFFIIYAMVVLYNINHDIVDYRFLSTIGAIDGENDIYRQSIDGHFYVEAEIDGKQISFLVDTGASKTIISGYDAKRLGINVVDGNYTEKYETPNGLISAAPIIIDELVIGSIILQDVPASVSHMRMKQSILGMNVLSQLNINFAGTRMMLRSID